MENQQTQQNLTRSLGSLKTERVFELINDSLIAAESRIGHKAINPQIIISDIMIEFTERKITEIQEAMRNGGLGKYGITYHLNSQVICTWIREYIKENKPDNLSYLFRS